MSTSPEYDSSSGILRSEGDTLPDQKSAEGGPFRRPSNRLRDHSSLAPKNLSSSLSNPYLSPPDRVDVGGVKNTKRPLDALEKGAQRQLKQRRKRQRGVSDRDNQPPITNTILLHKPEVRWTDIAGHDAAKEALKTGVILPLQQPSLLSGKHLPWRGILLYGPTGAGKSLLVNAVAHEGSDLTFFSISIADLLSMWHGESEKRVKALFAAAKEHKPSVIFIDQIDGLCASCKDGEECGCGVGAELTAQMDGIDRDTDGIVVIGATSVPWLLNDSIRRRFDKLIPVPLPNEQERAEVFRLNFEGMECELVWEDYCSLARRTHKYTGADIAVTCRDALMAPCRRVRNAQHFRLIPNPDKTSAKHHVYEICEPSDRGAIRMTFDDVPKGEYAKPAVTFADVEKALKSCKAQVGEESLYQFQEFTKRYELNGSL